MTRVVVRITLIAALLAVAIAVLGTAAPTERTMGHAQRIVYVHVAVAWGGLLGLLAAAASGVVYLRRRQLAWDDWFQSAAELGWLCCGLTLITGSLWARQAWGTWWEWDPRLTTSLVLWAIYSGILLVRGGLDDAHQRARISAVLAVLGAVDVPLVVMATRWFRGMHPAAPEMVPAMRTTLLLSIGGLTALFVLLAVRRRNQLKLERRVSELRRRAALL